MQSESKLRPGQVQRSSSLSLGAAEASAAYLQHSKLAMRLGGHARVGLEDNIYLAKGVLSSGSAPLVERAAAYARSIGRDPADPARARKILGLDGAPDTARSSIGER